jgi:uncharacterized protein YukE
VPDFDFEAADTAATELELTAQALLAIAALIETDAPDVTADWTGRFREVFDVEAANHDTAARSLADDLSMLAATVRARALEAAAAEAS